MIPVEIGHDEPFLLRAKETFYIDKFQTEKASASQRRNMDSIHRRVNSEIWIDNSVIPDDYLSETYRVLVSK